MGNGGMKLTQREMIVQIYERTRSMDERLDKAEKRQEQQEVKYEKHLENCHVAKSLKDHISSHWKFATVVIAGSGVIISLLILIIK